MTFQVSDVNITSRKFRRLATLHGLRDQAVEGRAPGLTVADALRYEDAAERVLKRLA